MNTGSVNIKKILRIKIAVITLMALSVMGSFATLGTYSSGKNNGGTRRSILAQKTILKPGTFSLKSGYLFRGGQLLSPQVQKYFNLNAVASYQVGNMTYVLPLKKQILMGKVSIITISQTR